MIIVSDFGSHWVLHTSGFVISYTDLEKWSCSWQSLRQWSPTVTRVILVFSKKGQWRYTKEFLQMLILSSSMNWFQIFFNIDFRFMVNVVISSGYGILEIDRHILSQTHFLTCKRRLALFTMTPLLPLSFIVLLPSVLGWG